MEAKDSGVKYEVLIQYDGLESNLSEIYQRVKNTYVAAGHDIESFKEIKLYIKPQDFTMLLTTITAEKSVYSNIKSHYISRRNVMAFILHFLTLYYYYSNNFLLNQNTLEGVYYAATL